MKILHIIEDISANSGGPSISAISMAAALTNINNNHVAVLCYEKSGHDETIENSRCYPGFNRIQWYTIQKTNVLEKIFAPRFCIQLLRLIRQYDVISIHGAWLPSLIQAGIVCNILRKPYIVVPHGMLDPWTLAYKKWKKYFVWHLCWKPIVNAATLIRALTYDEKQMMERIGISAPIEVIPNGIFDSQHRAIQEIPPHRPTDSHPSLQFPYILFLSRIHYKKGLDTLIEAFSTIATEAPDLKLVIAGPDESYWSEIKKLIDIFQLTEKVIYIGPIYGKHKYRLLKGALCFCLPSRQEGFSMAIIEAMSSGTPVIISRECHFNAVSDNNAGMVVSRTPSDIASAILNIYENPLFAKALSDNAIKLIKSNYTWEVLSQRYNNILLQRLQNARNC